MGPCTILLVEDNDDNRTIYRTILEHHGHRVVEAENGAVGVARASTAKPDLVLMDLAMPVMDGYEATRRLKASADTAQIPVVALTAFALADDRERAEGVGFDGYLTKPMEPQRLVSEVSAFLESCRPPVEDPSSTRDAPWR
jgi:CheY-like chemotaxis protein